MIKLVGYAIKERKETQKEIDGNELVGEERMMALGR